MSLPHSHTVVLANVILLRNSVLVSKESALKQPLTPTPLLQPHRNIKPYLPRNDSGMWQANFLLKVLDPPDPSVSCLRLWGLPWHRQRVVFSNASFPSFPAAGLRSGDSAACSSSVWICCFVNAWTCDADFFESELQAPPGKSPLFNGPSKSQ